VQLRRLMTTHRFYVCSSFIMILLLTLIMSGCTASRVIMYDGSEVEPGKQAVIRGDCEHSGEWGIKIVSVDGDLTTNFFGYTFHGWPNEVAVLPGKHDISALTEFRFASSRPAMRLWLIAEAGERYVVKTRSKGYAVTMWIENERTGQRAGGVSGSGDEPKKE